MNEEEIKKIAKLANLELDKEETAKMCRELASVVGYIDQLKEVNTESVEPTSQVTGLENVTREDKIDESNLLPQKGYFKVKAIFEEQ
jgi:aspartyl-tRNA(Asn)/glutamyl-tRNA(Gln) amidotransferase subunit C